jgi:nitrogen fixation NifU-like protein
MYSSKTIQYFNNQKNYGKIQNPDGVGKVGNIVCGDVMWLYIKLGKNKSGEEIIKNIKYETFGCVAAIATSGQVTELAKGKTIEQALAISKDAIISELGGLPPVKIHCSVLAVDALAEAIYDYLQKNKKPIPDFLARQHEVILDARGIIEDKYHDWVEQEEEMHKAGGK